MKKLLHSPLLASLCILQILSIGCAKQDKPSENIALDIDQALQLFGKQTDPQPNITPETPLAQVNETTITHGQLQQEMQNLAKSLPNTLTPEQRQEAQQQIANKALQNLIQNALIQEGIAKSNNQASDQEVSDQLAKVEEQLKEGQSLGDELAKQNISQDQYRDLVRKKLSLNNYFAEISKSAQPPSDEEIQTFYTENTNRFTRAAGVEARHILYKATTQDPGALFVEKKQAARAALVRVDAGEPFEKLIIELSEGPNAQNGGVLGFLQQGNTAPEIAEHVFDLKEGATTGVVRTQYGFHIIQVTKIHPAVTIGMDEAKEKISQLLLQQKKQKLITEHVKELRENATIEVLQN